MSLLGWHAPLTHLLKHDAINGLPYDFSKYVSASVRPLAIDKFDLLLMAPKLLLCVKIDHLVLFSHPPRWQRLPLRYFLHSRGQQFVHPFQHKMVFQQKLIRLFLQMLHLLVRHLE